MSFVRFLYYFKKFEKLDLIWSRINVVGAKFVDVVDVDHALRAAGGQVGGVDR